MGDAGDSGGPRRRSLGGSLDIDTLHGLMLNSVVFVGHIYRGDEGDLGGRGGSRRGKVGAECRAPRQYPGNRRETGNQEDPRGREGILGE